MVVVQLSIVKNTKKKNKFNITGRVIEVTTNENGYCKVDNLYCDVYKFDIKETNDFKKSQKVSFII